MVFQDLVGTTGTVTVATRGPGGPGEVSLQVNGSRESFLATSDEPLPRGAVVLVVECRPHRSVAVVPWIEPGSQARPDPVPPSGPSRS